MSKNGNGNHLDEKPKDDKDKERERFERDKRRRLDSMPPEYIALFGKEADDLIEVSIISERENLLNSVQIMQEQIRNPDRKKSLSQILREARLRGSIAVGGQGRKDIHLIGERKVQEQANSRGQAFDGL
jgi:hypothetical protein